MKILKYHRDAKAKKIKERNNMKKESKERNASVMLDESYGDTVMKLKF